MKKIMIIAMFTMVCSGSAYAADFNSLSISAAELKTAAEASPAAIEVGFENADRSISMVGETAFDRIKNMFEKGVPATKKDLLGWYTGRLVNGENNNQLVGALFIGRDDSGPLYEAVEKPINVIIVVNNTNVPDYFDNGRLSSYDLSMIKWHMRSSGLSVQFPDAKGVNNSSSVKQSVEVRKINGTIVVRMIYSRGTKSLEEYSYYFKNVPPQL